MTTRTHRGFRIESVVATQLGYRIHEGKDPGRGRKKQTFFIYSPDEPDRPIKTTDSLKAAVEYIDQYVGDGLGDIIEEGAGYYTVIVPPSTPNGLVPRSEWRDTEKTLTRGAFKTEARARAWAKEHIGKPYDVRYVPPLERGTEILDGLDERVPRWMR